VARCPHAQGQPGRNLPTPPASLALALRRAQHARCRRRRAARSRSAACMRARVLRRRRGDHNVMSGSADQFDWIRKGCSPRGVLGSDPGRWLFRQNPLADLQNTMKNTVPRRSLPMQRQTLCRMGCRQGCSTEKRRSYPFEQSAPFGFTQLQVQLADAYAPKLKTQNPPVLFFSRTSRFLGEGGVSARGILPVELVRGRFSKDQE
jgi:hypothetical protein